MDATSSLHLTFSHSLTSLIMDTDSVLHPEARSDQTLLDDSLVDGSTYMAMHQSSSKNQHDVKGTGNHIDQQNNMNNEPGD